MGAPADTVWTVERVAALKDLWAAGHSASHIAVQIGGVSRSAVLGKVHRLRLPMRVTKVQSAPSKPRKPRLRTRPAPKRPARPRQGKPVGLMGTPLPPPQAYDVARVSLHDLEPHHCRFPVGDPKEAGFGFCGARAIAGTSWCARHLTRVCEAPTLTVRPARAAARRSQLVEIDA